MGPLRIQRASRTTSPIGSASRACSSSTRREHRLPRSGHSMPFGRPPLSEMLNVVDFVIDKDSPVRGIVELGA